MTTLSDTIKKGGLIYTPDWIVKIIHDTTLPADTANVAICDPACGDGAFLVDIATRICTQAARAHNPTPYFNSLHHLTGFDIDSVALDECKSALDTVVHRCFPDLNIKWNLHVVDAIHHKQWAHWIHSFDYVVGNPPYVRIQHLEPERRKLIRAGGWKTLSGCTDLYMLFFEYGMKLLKKGGSLSYITPNSWMKSKAGAPLRHFLNSYDLQQIIDFDYYQVFEGVTTYTAITQIKNAAPTHTARASKFVDTTIEKNYRLVEYQDKWICLKDTTFLIPDHSKDVALKDVADIRVGIQTLADTVFILQALQERHGVVMCTHHGEKFQIEAGIGKKILKASVMQRGIDKVNRIIIYPYDRAGNLISEQELSARFPRAYRWLLSKRDILLNRDKGRHHKYKWYEYGRGVGIKTAFGVKILTSGINKKPNFQISHDKEALFYSGYSITPKDWVDTSKLIDQLNSQYMELYIASTSKPFRNGWRSYAKSFIQDFPLNSCTVRYAPPR